MSSRSVQIIGGSERERAHVDGATNALKVFLVNGGGGGGTSDVNIVSIGGNPVTTTLPVSGTVAVTQSTSPWVITGAVGVTQLTDPWNILGTVSVSNFPATYTVVQATHADLNAQVRLQDRDGSGLLSVLNVASSAAAPTAELGTIPLCLVTDNPEADGGTWAPPRMNEAGSLYVTITNGSLNVAGTVAVTGNVTVIQPVAANLNVTAVQGGTWNIGTVTPGTGATNLGKAEDAAHASGDVGVQCLAVRRDADGVATSTNGDYEALQTNNEGFLKVITVVRSGDLSTGYRLEIYRAQDGVPGGRPYGTTLLAEVSPVPMTPVGISGQWNHPYMDENTGGILVSVVSGVSATINSVVPGTGSGFLGKAEDQAALSGDVGVMALAVRRDTLASTTSANNDYATLNVDAVGALWTREAGLTTIALSGSTRGRPIAISGTASGSANTIHTATTTTGQLDRVYIWLTNTSSNSVTITIEFGTTGTGNELNIIVPAKETVLAVDGAVLGGAATDTIKAYASTASVVNAFGRVERLS